MSSYAPTSRKRCILHPTKTMALEVTGVRQAVTETAAWYDYATRKLHTT